MADLKFNLVPPGAVVTVTGNDINQEIVKVTTESLIASFEQWKAKYTEETPNSRELENQRDEDIPECKCVMVEYDLLSNGVTAMEDKIKTLKRGREVLCKDSAVGKKYKNRNQHFARKNDVQYCKNLENETICLKNHVKDLEIEQK
ncbi:hypothetical protein SLS57_009797 [Botryosphaeria dothidea]